MARAGKEDGARDAGKFTHYNKISFDPAQVDIEFKTNNSLETLMIVTEARHVKMHTRDSSGIITHVMECSPAQVYDGNQLSWKSTKLHLESSVNMLAVMRSLFTTAQFTSQVHDANSVWVVFCIQVAWTDAMFLQSASRDLFIGHWRAEFLDIPWILNVNDVNQWHFYEVYNSMIAGIQARDAAALMLGWQELKMLGEDKLCSARVRVCNLMTHKSVLRVQDKGDAQGDAKHAAKGDVKEGGEEFMSEPEAAATRVTRKRKQDDADIIASDPCKFFLLESP